MKKIIFLSVVLVLIGAGCSLQKNQNTLTTEKQTNDGTVSGLNNHINTSDWRVYHNEKFGFEIKLPPKWSNVKISNEYNSFYNGENFTFELENIFRGYESVCNIIVQTYENWASYKKDEVINKTKYIVDYNGNVYSYSCGHEDLGYVDFPDYNVYAESEEISKGNYNYDRAGGPFDEFSNLIIPTFNQVILSQ